MLTRRRSEAEVQRAILDYLSTRGDVVAWRANTGAQTVRDDAGKARFMRFGFKGCPDIVGYVRRNLYPHKYSAIRLEAGMGCAVQLVPTPIFLAIECKAEGKASTVTKDQAAFLQRVGQDGGIALVADDVQTVAEALG